MQASHLKLENYLLNPGDRLNLNHSNFPLVFKGIALFTPGGDLIYCIDPRKEGRWHLNLCAALQEMLGLSEPPHFLVPCYTATIDRWHDPRTQQLRTAAEAYAPVLRHQALLNLIFGTSGLVWQAAPWQEALCNPMVLANYRTLFPKLWQEHDLIVRYEPTKSYRNDQWLATSSMSHQFDTHGYVFRLFVSGNTPATERTLKTLHQLLEETLHQPYTLKVIDVVQHPELAEVDQVSATPTLLRVWPKPVRRIVGELDRVEKILTIITGSEI